MSFSIYANICEGSHYHFGWMRDGAFGHVRTIPDFETQPIVDFVDVHLDDGVPPSWSEIDLALNEALAAIPDHQVNHVYDQKTTHARVQLLFSGEILDDNAAHLKKFLRTVAHTLSSEGKPIPFA